MCGPHFTNDLAKTAVLPVEYQAILVLSRVLSDIIQFVVEFVAFSLFVG
jgi:hypothetical protein